MQKKDCKYFPCHKEHITSKEFDCSMCYCPIYPCEIPETGGKMSTFNNKEIWDCINCSLIHKERIVEKIVKRIVEVTKEIIQGELNGQKSSKTTE